MTSRRFAFAALLLLAGCTDNAEAVHALEDVGFSDVTILSGSPNVGFSACGDDDGAVYSAMATNPAGKRVRVLVCCGGFASLKGCTVRSR